MHTRARPARRSPKTVLLAFVLALATTAAPATAAAAVPPFYETPAQLPAANGAVIRSEPSVFYVDPLKAVRADADAHRILYRSTDAQGQPIAVSGTVLTPKKAWTGKGERPLVGYAVGTQGMGDDCAPSRLFAAGAEYEGIFISGLLARGYAVAVTDYEGLGTEGVHTYMNRRSQGAAVLDSIRAAQQLPAANLPDDGPVAITGYSQGGGAAASAAELAGTYAPELNVVGTVAGAAPADLDLVAEQIDGALYVAFLGYAVAGQAAAYDLDLSPVLNAKGEEMIAALEEQCLAESLLSYAFTRSETLTDDGRPVTDILAEEPFASLVDEQRLGFRKPSAPVLVTHSVLDDVIPYRSGLNMAQRWCDRGANVRLSTNALPTHIGGLLASYADSFLFLEARFAGVRAASSCWRL